MEDAPTIFVNMFKLDGHGLDRTIKHTWVVNIVPGVKELVSALKFLELVLPVLTRIFIQEVHESRVSRPGLSIESLS